MRYVVAPEVWHSYPDLKTGLVMAAGVRNGDASPGVEALLADAEASLKAEVVPEALSQHPHVAAWRRAYSAFGVTPSQYRNAAEAVARHVLRRGSAPRVNAAVDLGNACSLRCLLPVAVWDVDSVDGDMIIRFARGDEPFTDLASQDVSYPAPGEVIYGDDRRALSRRWNWRGALETVATPESANVLFTVEGVGPGADAVEEATRALAANVEEHLGAQVRCEVLHRDHQWAQVSP